MNMKKLMAAFTAAAMAVTMSAVSAFAATVTLDDGYVGSWGAGACIPKTELEAIGGDVKVTLDIETLLTLLTSSSSLPWITITAGQELPTSSLPILWLLRLMVSSL